MKTVDPHCRIARVRLKAGGAVSFIALQKPLGDRGQKMLEFARELSRVPDGVCGFVIVTWNRGGEGRIGYAQPADGPISQSLIPGFIAEVFRRRTHEQDLLHIVFGAR